MRKWIFITLICLCSVAVGAKNEWVLGGPQDTYDVEEWTIGQPAVNIDGTAAPPTGGRSFGVIIASIPFGIFGICGIALAFGYSERKAA